VDLLDKQRLFSGRGLTDWFSVASPAAGANASFTVGGRNVEGLRVVAALATVATDANAADRLLALDYIDARSVTRVRSAATLLVTANTSATVFQWDHAHAVSEWQTGTPVFAPLADVILTPGWTVQLTLDSKQAGDQLSAISFVVEAFYAD
jgi:predicted phage gp36 major capsid-like protein